MTPKKNFFWLAGVVTASLLLGEAACAAQINQGVSLKRPSIQQQSVILKDKAKAAKTTTADSLSLAANKDAAQQKAKYAKGEVLVKYKSGISLSRASASLMAGGLTVAKEYRKLSTKNGRAFVLVKGARSTAELMQRLKKDPNVESVSPNYIRTLSQTPNDPQMSELWGMNNTGQSVNGVAGTADADIDAPEAWDTATGSANTVVAVFDTGVDYTHVDLADNMWVNSGEVAGNGLDDDGNGYADDVYGYDFAADDVGGNASDPMDLMGHGTHVSGTIGAVGNDGAGITGVNWDVSIMALKLARPDGGLYDSDILEAIDYVLTMKDAGVNIVAINASYGGYGGDQTDPMNTAIQSLGDAGIVFVAAAGNDGSDNDAVPHFPSSYDADNIIAVAATDQDDQLASFSNWGATTVDIAAPGVNIYSTLPGGSGYDPQPTDLFYEDFDPLGNNWTAASNTTVNWDMTTEDSYSPDKSMTDSVGGPYANDTLSQLWTTDPIDLSGASGNIRLGFWAKIDVEVGWDQFFVMATADGVNWEILATFDGEGLPWQLYDVYIPERYRTAQFQFGVGLDTDGSVVYDGVHIDNIGIADAGPSVNYDYWNGTSMAAPHVTGAVALLASTYPTETVAQRRNRILLGAQSLANLNGVVASGGRLNLNNSIDPALIGPVVNDITPSTGMLAGSSFTISGTDFGDTQGRVLFTDGNGDSVEATVSSWSAASIIAVVPETAGKYITVEDSTGHASTPFIGSSREMAGMTDGVHTNGYVTVEHNGKIYTFTGYDYESGNLSTVAEVYEPATGVSTLLSPLPVGLEGASGAVIDGVVYILGGASDVVQTYDIASDTWSQTTTPCPTTLTFPAVAAVDGKLYVSGGSVDFSLAGAMNTLYVYDPAEDAWTALAPMSENRLAHGMVPYGNKLYVLGGMNYAGNVWTYLQTAEVYDIATDTWSALPDMPMPLADMGTAVGIDVGGDFIGVAGGTNDSVGGWWGSHVTVTMNFDFAANSWQYQPDDLDDLIEHKRGRMAFVENRGFYSVSGLASAGGTKNIEFLGGYTSPTPPPSDDDSNSGSGGSGGGGAMGLLFMLFGLFALGGRAVRRRYA